MAKAGHGYPQVVARAADLVDERVITLSARRSVERALAAVRSARAVIVTDGGRRAARVTDLERAREWQLGRRRWADVAWTNVPILSGSVDEISARRLVKTGASIVLVRDGRRVIGAIRRAVQAGPSLAGKLERLQGAAADARLWLLRGAGKLSEAHGHAVYAAGGVVRDLVPGRDADQMADLDLVVEDDGIAFARRLGEEIGGHLILHTAFGTASIEGAATPDGTRLPRVDIATARRERYPRPGALPEVSPLASRRIWSVAISPSTPWPWPCPPRRGDSSTIPTVERRTCSPGGSACSIRSPSPKIPRAFGEARAMRRGSGCAPTLASVARWLLPTISRRIPRSRDSGSSLSSSW